MGTQVIWTARAERDLSHISASIRRRWTQLEVDGFLQRLDRTVRCIERDPGMFRALSRKGYREALIDKHNSIIYRRGRSKAYVITIWDLRKDPRKKPVK